MSSPLPSPIAFLVILTGLAVVGFTSNTFIIAVIVIEWTKSRSLNSSNLLLLCLGMSNICSTASLTEIYTDNFSNYLLFQVISIFMSIAIIYRFWFTAWLCVFYCIRIVNSTHSLFLWCKQRISWLLPWLLVASTTTSIISPIFAFQLVLVPLQSNSTTVNSTDVGQEELVGKIPSEYKVYFLVIGSSCPLLVVLLCSVTIVASLYRHICQMAGKESSFRNPQTEAHFKAAGTVLFLLFLYLSFYIVDMLTLVPSMEGNQILFGVYSIAVMGYAPAQAAILVLVNPRLKQALTQLLPGKI